MTSRIRSARQQVPVPPTPARPAEAPRSAVVSRASAPAFEQSGFQGAARGAQWARFLGGGTGGGTPEPAGPSGAVPSPALAANAAVPDVTPTFEELRTALPGQPLGLEAEAFWGTLRLEQQQDLLAVASVSTGDGDAALARMLASPEQQQRLLDTGSVGGQCTLECLGDIAMDNLAGATADAPMRTDLDTVRGEVVNQLLLTLEDPLRITQGESNTCTMASAQVSLVLARPAEYARILRDLVINGQATLAGGRTVSLPVDVVPNESRIRRQDDYLFQSALMQEVVRIDSGEPNRVYDPSTSDQLDPARGGQREVYNELFGGTPVDWPLDNLAADTVNGMVRFMGVVLALYSPDGGMGHAVSVVGAETDPATGETYLIVRNALPEGAASAVGENAPGVGETQRIPVSSLSDGTYGGYSLLVTGASY